MAERRPCLPVLVVGVCCDNVEVLSVGADCGECVVAIGVAVLQADRDPEGKLRAVRRPLGRRVTVHGRGDVPDGLRCRIVNCDETMVAAVGGEGKFAAVGGPLLPKIRPADYQLHRFFAGTERHLP